MHTRNVGDRKTGFKIKDPPLKSKKYPSVDFKFKGKRKMEEE